MQGAALGKDTGRYHITNLALSRFVDGELDEQDRRRVGDHLNSCVHCRSIVAGYARLNGELSSGAQHTRDVPYSVTWRLMSAIEASPTGFLLRVGRLARSVPATAGSLSAALLLVIGLAYMHHNTRPTVSPPHSSHTTTDGVSAMASRPVSRAVIGTRLRDISSSTLSAATRLSRPGSQPTVRIRIDPYPLRELSR